MSVSKRVDQHVKNKQTNKQTNTQSVSMNDGSQKQVSWRRVGGQDGHTTLCLYDGAVTAVSYRVCTRQVNNTCLLKGSG
jgi:hypothetical protein